MQLHHGDAKDPMVLQSTRPQVCQRHNQLIYLENNETRGAGLRSAGAARAASAVLAADESMGLVAITPATLFAGPYATGSAPG